MTLPIMRPAVAIAVLLAASSLPWASAYGMHDQRIGLANRRSAAAKTAASVKQPGDVSGLADAEDLIPVGDTQKAAKNLGEAAKIAASQDITLGVKSALDAAEAQYQGNTPAPKVASAKAGEDVTAESPESPEMLAGYMVAQATMPPAPFNGVYCRGGACQYRVPPPPLDAPTLPPLPPPSEMCRGLGCPPPAPDLALLSFVQNCSLIFTRLGGGVPGGGAPPTIGDVRAAFQGVCDQYLPLESCSCSSYADVFVGALAPTVRSPSVGSLRNACQNAYFFVEDMKSAEVDLGLAPGSAPPSLLQGEAEVPGEDNPFAHEAAGLCSPRGQRWRKWLEARNQERGGLGLLQELPRVENAPCSHGFAKPKPAAMKYTIAPPCAAGLPPSEVDGDIYQNCVDTFAEITLGAGRAAPDVVTLTEEWCGWQSMVTSLVDSEDQEQGRPDWDQRTCKRMGTLVAFALRNDLESKAGQGAQTVCKKLFIASGLVQRVGKLVHEHAAIGGRGAPVGSSAPSADDPEVKAMLKKAAELAQAIYKKLEMQKAALNAVADAKTVVSQWEEDQKEKEEPPPGDDLPNADDMSLNLISLRSNHLRHWGKGDVPRDR